MENKKFSSKFREVVFDFWFHKSYICTYTQTLICANKHAEKKNMCVVKPGIAATLLVSLSQLATSLYDMVL